MLRGVYHIERWRLPWSMDRDHLYEFSFTHSNEAPSGKDGRAENGRNAIT